MNLLLNNIIFTLDGGSTGMMSGCDDEGGATLRKRRKGAPGRTVLPLTKEISVGKLS